MMNELVNGSGVIGAKIIRCINDMILKSREI